MEEETFFLIYFWNVCVNVRFSCCCSLFPKPFSFLLRESFFFPEPKFLRVCLFISFYLFWMEGEKRGAEGERDSLDSLLNDESESFFLLLLLLVIANE